MRTIATGSLSLSFCSSDEWLGRQHTTVRIPHTGFTGTVHLHCLVIQDYDYSLPVCSPPVATEDCNFTDCYCDEVTVSPDETDT